LFKRFPGCSSGFPRGKRNVEEDSAPARVRGWQLIATFT
jgi:hypothetical protein